MGSPVQPQAQQALGPLEVFIDTQLPTRIFMRCHLLDSMSDLQAKFVQEHLDCFPEHGIVRCKRLECNITLDNKSCSYAIPQTYRFSDLGAFAQGISENHLVFHMQVELCNSQAQLEGHQGSHAPHAPQLQSSSQPPLALPAVAAQPAAALQPAESASLQAQASVPLALEGPPAAAASLQPQASVPLPEQPAKPEGRSKHKKRKRSAEAAEASAEANVAATQHEDQAGTDEAQADASGTERQKRRRKKKSRGPSVEAEARTDSPAEDENQPAKDTTLKRKHKAATEEDGPAAGTEDQPSNEAEERHAAAAEDGEDAATAPDAPDAAATAVPTEAVDAEHDGNNSARNKKRRKKQKMRHAQARAHAVIAALTATAAAEAAGAAAKGNTAIDSKDVMAAADDTDAAAVAEAPVDSIADDASVRPADGKKKKKKKKKRRSKLPDNEDDEEAAQQDDGAAAEAVETAAEENVPQITQPGSSQAHRGAVHAEAVEPNGEAAATANNPTASGLQQAQSADHSSQKKKGKKSLAEAAAAYGMDLPPHLAEGNTGGSAAAATGNEAAPAQGMDEEQPDPASSGWKMRRRELLPELDAAEDVPDPVMPPATSGGTSAEVVPPTASDPDTKAQVDAAIASVRKLANGQLDPDQAGQSNQAMGDTAASRGRAASDALAMMPAIPASTSGLVSPDDVSAQHPSGYGQSSSSDSGSKSDADPAAEKGVQGAAEMRANMQKIWRELQGWQADAEARAAADVEAKQAATSSTSLLPSSSSSEDENQAEQQPAASGGEVNGDMIVPQHSGSDDSVSRDLGSDDSSSDDSSSENSEIPRPTVASGATQDDLTQPDLPSENVDEPPARNGQAGQNGVASHQSDRNASADHVQLTQQLSLPREDMSSSGDSDSSDDNSEDEQPPDLPNGASVTRKRAILPAEANPYGTMGLEALLEAATKDKGLESARGLEVEREEDDDLGANARRYKRQPLINPMSAVVAQGGSQGEPQAHKKRGRPSKGSFSVTADSDLLDQVARRPVQDWGPATKQASVLKRAVKAWLNEDRVARGLKEVHSNIYQQNAPPAWWPLPQWDSSQIERKAPCQQVYAAMQKYMRENQQHYGSSK